MISVLLSQTRLVAAIQKKVRTGANLQPLCAIPITGEPDAYAEIAASFKKRLDELGIKDKKLDVVLGEEVIFKEFNHQPVNQKALIEFAQLETKTVLRQDASAYSVACMNYGTHQNENGEQTAMLLATPTITLKSIRTGFASVGLQVENIHTMFGCYAAALQQVLPKALPNLTGAAIDFSYEYTIINLYQNGDLISQRRLQGMLAALVPAVKEDTGCADAEVAEKLAENKFSPNYSQRAAEALTNYVYDILRTLRVISSPLHIDMQQFFLSGDACRDTSFLNLVREGLSLPCTLADEVFAQASPYISTTQPITGLFVLAGAAYDDVDLLNEFRQNRTSSLISAGTCVIVAAAVVVGMLVPVVAKGIKKSTLTVAEARYAQLAPLQQAITAVQTAQSTLDSLTGKQESISGYNSNTNETLTKMLSEFGQGLTIQSIAYDAETGAYDVSFVAYSEQYFLDLKDKLYKNTDYYLDLQTSLQYQYETDDYLCNLHFIPYDYHPLPSTQSSEAAAQAAAAAVSDATVTSDDITSSLGGV